PTATPSAYQPTAPPTDAAPTPPPTITLTIWTTERFSPTQAITSGQILAEQARLFEANHPDVRLRFVLKKPQGKGGILDYLLTTNAVVPDLLPDLVFLDMDDLGTVVQAGLLQPLGDVLPPDLTGDLYPLAQQAGTVDGQLYGLQYLADLEHLVYNTGKMTAAPASWPGVLSNPGPYLFPAGGQAGLVNDAFLIQYLAVHPWSPEQDEPFLDKESLIAVLQYYQDGVTRGIFPGDILNYQTADDCWRAYLAGEAALSHVRASRYLAERGRSQSTAPAPIPAIDGPAAAIGQGWGLALVTSDPGRQALAVELMLQLMDPATNAAWNRAAGFLPTRQTALVEWDLADGYTQFIDQQLQTARPHPPVANYTQIAAALQTAVESVLTGAATPEEAAEQVVSSVQ
ncbi:MAG TPA: extracellular solute-binding protein, partial [Anaerolineae bacterium]|nr:extracellular solute-binding protein [Anaerolineae bacterium]